MAKVTDTVTANAEAFGLFIEVAMRFKQDKPVLRQILVTCREKFAGAGIRLAQIMTDRKDLQSAAVLFDDYFLEWISDEENTSAFEKAYDIAVKLGKTQEAASILETLYVWCAKTEKAFSIIVSIAYVIARSGDMNRAHNIWTRIYTARNEDAEVLKRHRRYYRAIVKEMQVAPALLIPSELDEPVQGPHNSPPKGKVKLTERKDRSHLPDQCRASLTTRSTNGAMSKWLNLTTRCAREGDLLTANRIWKVVLNVDPTKVFSFLQFSDTWNKGPQSGEIADLLQYASALCQRQRDPTKKGKNGPEIFVRRGVAINNADILEKPLQIGEKTLKLNQWLAHAGDCTRHGKYREAVQCWMYLFHADNQTLRSVLRGFIHMSRELDEVKFLKELRIDEMTVMFMHADSVYCELALELRSVNRELSGKILQSVHKLRPDSPGNTLALSRHYIAQRKFDEAVSLWLPVKESHARECAAAASALLAAGRTELATRLFTDISKVSPLSSLLHGYEFFQDLTKSAHVLACLRPLLPAGNEEKLEDYHIFALRLFFRHSGDSGPHIQTAAMLEERGVLTEAQAAALRSIAISSAMEKVRSKRDAELEAFLELRIPELKTSNFFNDLQERKPVMSTGKKTTGTTAQVLRLPGAGRRKPRF